MKHTLTVAAREIRDTSFLFIAAALLALIPFIAFMLPGAGRTNRAEMIAILGFVVASNFAIVVAIMLGASMVGRELTEKRLSFYFSRPLPAASIWFGKLTAALLMTVIAYVIIATPAALVSTRAWQSTWPISPVQSIGFAAAIGLVILLLAHTISTGVRSRSPLVFADLAGVGVTAAAVWLIIRPLADAMAGHVLNRYAFAFAVGVGVILIAGGAWQMSRGRIDAKRNHFELSKFVWAAMAAFLLTLAIFTAWFVRVDVSDLVHMSGGVQAPRGPWTLLSGNYRGRADYSPILLYDMQNGRSARMDGLPWQVKLSSDGQSVMWTRNSGFGRREICMTTLSGKPSTTATGINVRPGASFILSDDHRQVAVLEGTTLSVHDLSGPRLIGSARVLDRNSAMYFIGSNRVRLISRWRPASQAGPGPEGISVVEFDAGSKSLAQSGRLDLGQSRAFFSASPDGSRLLVNHWSERNFEKREVLLLDARTAAVIANLGQPGRGFAARFLSDGRIVTSGSVDGRVSVHLFSADGAHLGDIDAGSGEGAYGPVVIAPNRIALLETVTLADRSRKPTVVIVDLDRGVVASLPDLWPAEGYNLGFYGDDPRAFNAEPNRPLLLTDRKSTLWKWDPATGAKTKIAGE